jgi:hypothetical protein
MKRLLVLTLAMLLLTACDTQSERDQAEAAKLTAQSQLVQTQTNSDTVSALIDALNARVGDYQAVLTLAVLLAAGSMAVSVALVFALARLARN